jgi:hypothetical protein
MFSNPGYRGKVGFIEERLFFSFGSEGVVLESALVSKFLKRL